MTRRGDCDDGIDEAGRDRAMSAPVRKPRRRCPDDVATKEMPAVTMADLAAEAHARIGGGS